MLQNNNNNQSQSQTQSQTQTQSQSKKQNQTQKNNNKSSQKPQSKNKTLKPFCPYCNKNKYIVKIGYRTNKTKKVQRFRCNSCNKTFINQPLKYTTYPPKIIFNAISTYNLGNTDKQTAKIIRRKHKIEIPITTIHAWLKRYQNICTFTLTLRKHFKLDPKTIIYSKKFYHQQVYEFKYHTLKLNIAGKTIPAIKNYIRSVPHKCPEKPFMEGPRCSKLKIDFKPTKTTKYNNAPKLAALAQTLARSNHDRHTKVENFFLVNDTSTLAIEVPVYIYPNELTKREQYMYCLNLQEPLSGHIDILQVRFNKIHILDYKPDAKRNDKSTADQLFLYALALSKRTKLSMDKFICAYFDENNYYQFTPILH